MDIFSVCAKAKENVSYPANLCTEEKNNILKIISNTLIEKCVEIIDANKKDIESGREYLSQHLIDRLSLNEDRIKGMAKGVEELIALNDPIGSVLQTWTNYAGLNISRVRVPLGVVGIIYEARPNVTSDTIALCIKTGNAIVLRGSKDAINSNQMIVKVIKESLTLNGYNSEWIQLITDITREGANKFMDASDYVDVLVPRGSAKLIQSVKKNASIPVIETGAGNCHIYVHESADYIKAEQILINGKVQRPSVCNALESMLIDESIADDFLPKLVSALKAFDVTVYGCEKSVKICDSILLASDEDYGKEYLGLEISVKIVSGVSQAIKHINKFSTHHSEVIIAEDSEASKQFIKEIDSSTVYVNASTRFTDGGEFGFGAELGISTQKLHVRGPIGPEQLTSFKYIVEGQGQIRK